MRWQTCLRTPRDWRVRSMPMQDVGAACAELERAITELNLLGAYIGTDIGRPLNDPALDPFYEKVVQLNVPLMIHPAPAGIDGPAGDPNLKQFDLDLLTGFAAQESIAVATLIFVMLQRHPEIDICPVMQGLHDVANWPF